MAFVRYYVGDVVKMKNHILVAVMSGKLSESAQTSSSYVMAVDINS